MKKTRYKTVITYTIFIFLVILSRVIFLDADIPGTAELTSLYPIDEGFYTQSAFNLYNYGSFNYDVVPYVSDDAGISNLFQTILTYTSLLIFGNNYYGIRIPSVFISLITIFLFYLILKELNIKHIQNKKMHLLIILGYFITDFQFFLTSRIFVTTIFRLFSLTLIIYLFLKFFNTDKTTNYKNIIVLTIASSFSVFFVSIYNIFIYTGVIFTLLLISIQNNWKGKKKYILSQTIVVIIITLIMLSLFLIYLKLAYNKTLIDYIKALTSLDDRAKMIFSLNSDSFIIGLLKKIFYPISKIVSTNIFRFNISFLFLFLYSIPFFIYRLKKYKNLTDLLILNLSIFLYLQLIFENTYPGKRLLMLLPIALIIIFNTINIKVNNKKLKLYKYFIFIISIYVFIKFNILDKNNSSLLAPHDKYYNGNLTIYFIIISIISFIIIVRYYKTNLSSKVLFFLFLILPNIYLIYFKTYKSPQYHYRDTMIKLAHKINDRVIPGQFSFSFRFYNKSIPILNQYHYILKPNNYSRKLFESFKHGHKQILQFPYNKNQFFTIKKNIYINLIVDDVYYIGRGKFIVLYNVIMR